MEQTIKYSISMRSNPMRPDEDEKAYANFQSNGKVDIVKLSEHIRQHGSPFSQGTITGVVTDACECIAECLKDGMIVSLGNLGTLRPSLTSEGAVAKDGKTAAENFTADNIKAVNINFEPGTGLKIKREDYKFEYVITREAQDKVKAAQKAGETSADISSGSGSGGGANPGSGDNISGD